jgi:hypothetical protein
MPDPLTAAESASPLPSGERSREARVKGTRRHTSLAETSSPQPSPRRFSETESLKMDQV